MPPKVTKPANGKPKALPVSRAEAARRKAQSSRDRARQVSVARVTQAPRGPLAQLRGRRARLSHNYAYSSQVLGFSCSGVAPHPHTARSSGNAIPTRAVPFNETSLRTIVVPEGWQLLVVGKPYGPRGGPHGACVALLCPNNDATDLRNLPVAGAPHPFPAQPFPTNVDGSWGTDAGWDGIGAVYGTVASTLGDVYTAVSNPTDARSIQVVSGVVRARITGDPLGQRLVWASGPHDSRSGNGAHEHSATYVRPAVAGIEFGDGLRIYAVRRTSLGALKATVPPVSVSGAAPYHIHNPLFCPSRWVDCRSLDADLVTSEWRVLGSSLPTAGFYQGQGWFIVASTNGNTTVTIDAERLIYSPVAVTSAFYSSLPLLAEDHNLPVPTLGVGTGGSRSAAAISAAKASIPRTPGDPADFAHTVAKSMQDHPSAAQLTEKHGIVSQDSVHHPDRDGTVGTVEQVVGGGAIAGAGVRVASHVRNGGGFVNALEREVPDVLKSAWSMGRNFLGGAAEEAAVVVPEVLPYLAIAP